MFIGHFALAFGAKRVAPMVSLGALFMAAQFADLLWPTLLLLGFEVVRIEPGNTVLTPLDFVKYPYSHSLVALMLWGGALAAGFRVVRGSGPVAMLTLAALVVSHWVLDALTHRPDMPLTIGGSLRVGLGLWNRPASAISAEVLLFAAGLGVYAHCTKARDRAGRWGVWALAAFLVAVYGANFAGPPPPSATAVAWAAQAMWLLVLWGLWVDRHRQPA